MAKKKLLDYVKLPPSPFTSELGAATSTLTMIGATKDKEGAILPQALGELGDSVFNSTTPFQSTNEQRAAVGNATLAAVDSIAQREIAKLNEMLNRKRTVKLKTLIGAVGGMAYTIPEMGEFLGKKLNKFVDTIPERLTAATQRLGAYASEISQDPDLQASLASLNEVQRFSSVIQSVGNVMTTATKILNVVEPFLPVVSIIVSAASIFATGGVSAAAFTTESALLAAEELKRAIPLIVKPVKEYVYNIEIKNVPEILLTIAGELTSPEAQQSFSNAQRRLEDALYASDAAYAKAIAHSKGLTFSTGFNATNAALQRYNPVTGSFILGALGDLARKGLDLRSLYLNVLGTDTALVRAAQIRANALEPLPSSLSYRDIVLLSKRFVDAAQASSSKFFVNRQMMKMIVEDLVKDGIIANAATKEYKERETSIGGAGFRSSFRKLNNAITQYHALLSAITGEVRANLYETIPVLDYATYHASLTDAYTGDRYENYTSTAVISNTDLQAWMAVRATSTDSMEAESPSRLSINHAVSDSPIKAWFYGSPTPGAGDPELCTDMPSGSMSQSPGILNGRFSTWALDAEQKPVWTWTIPLTPASIRLPLGTKYQPSHIYGKGNPVAKPLATATPGFEGRATELYSDVTQFIQNNIINPNKFSTVAEWALANRTLPQIKGISQQSVAISGSSTTVSRYLLHRANTFWERLLTPVTYGWQMTLVNPSFKYPTKAADANPNLLPNLISAGSHVSFNHADSDVHIIEVDWAQIGQIQRIEDAKEEARRILRTSATKNRVAVVSYFQRNVYGVVYTGPTPAKWFHYLWPGNYSIQVTGTSIAGNIRYIASLTPFDILQPQLPNFNDFPYNEFLFIPGSQAGNISQGMWLISKRDLGFDITTHRKLCTFYTNGSARDGGRCATFQVTAVKQIQDNTAGATTYEVITPTRTYTYSRDPGAPVYDPNDSATWSNAAPDSMQTGQSCWMYKLQAIDVGDPDLVEAFYPLSSEGFMKFIKGTSTLQNAQESFYALDNMYIAVGLPPNNEYNVIATPGGPNFSTIGRVIGPAAQLGFIREQLKDIDAILDTADAELNIKLPFLANTLTSIRSCATQLARLVADQATQTAFPGEGGATINMGGFKKFINQGSLYSGLISALNTFFGTASSIEGIYAQCLVMDQWLGNSGGTSAVAGKRWFSYGYDSMDTISIEDMESLISKIKQELEGSSRQGVKRLPGEPNAAGDANSLYFKRYQVLNARMHRSEGSLAQAAGKMQSWKIMSKQLAFNENSITNNLATTSLDARVVAKVEPLIYIPPSNGQPGRFYLQSVIDYIKSQIHGKCLLVCIPCPVKDDCPFYDEESVLKKYTPATNSLELWFKDNRLDLLNYENGRLVADEGSHISKAVMDRRHAMYAAIKRDGQSIIGTIELGDMIQDKVSGFRLPNGEYLINPDLYTGGRYGTIGTSIGNIQKSKLKGARDAEAHSYLPNALYIRDQHTEFEYKPSDSKYPVTIQSKGKVLFKGKVGLMVPSDLTLFKVASPYSKVYLVSDDMIDEAGMPMEPIIFLNTLGNLVYNFEGADSTQAQDTNSPFGWEWPDNADIAQWSANIYKGIEMEDSNNDLDQYWMPEVIRPAKNGKSPMMLPGRPRVEDVVESLVDESNPPTIEDIARGKPLIRSYINFARKMSLSLDSIMWAESANEAVIERKRMQLPSMRTNLRIVVVRPGA